MPAGTRHRVHLPGSSRTGDSVITLPTHPRLSDRFTVIEISPDECRLVSPVSSLQVRSKSANLLSRLVPLLDGSHSTSEIITLLEPFTASQVHATLRHLHQAGVIETPEHPVPGSIEERDASTFQDQIAFFANFAAPAIDQQWLRQDIPQSGMAYQKLLREASVMILGLGRYGSLLARSLVQAGVGHIGAIDSNVVSARDLVSPGWYPGASTGVPRTDAIGTAIANEAPGTTFSTPATTPETPEQYATEFRDFDVVVVCADHHDPGLYDLANTACLAANTPWTSLRVAEFEVEIGPTILPHETPCFACLEARRVSNVTDYEDYLLMDQHHRQAAVTPRTLALAPGVDLLALEVVKLITKFVQPATLGHLFTCNLLTLESALHPVLKIPRCPACGTPSWHRPPMQLWQQFKEWEA